MNRVLRGALDRFCMVYLDDILVFSKTPQEHEEHLRWVFSRLCEHSLHVKRSKCSFGKTLIECLGHLVSASGIQPDPRKVEAVA